MTPDEEYEYKQLKIQLKKAERQIKKLEQQNEFLMTANAKAISIREVAEAELLKAKEKAELADNAKSSFLASMSHEIRTPINAVLGMNELILRESTEPNIVEYANDINSSGKMLLALINDILDFSKIESGKMEIIPVGYDLSSVVNDIINMLSIRASDKGLKLMIDVDKDIPAILRGDEIRIRQIITNLVTNAIKYTDKGHVKITFNGYKEAERYLLKVTVSDTGKGIKEADMAGLFEAFQRADETANRHIEGTGLGLALTKGFVDMMDGTIGVQSEYGKGSTFFVTIPQEIVNDVPIGDFNARIRANKGKKGQSGIRLYVPGLKVLVVDDVKMNCKVFCGLLKHSGIEIDTALSGAEALDKCEQKKYDIIFMDHRMPEMDGVECFHKIRELESPNKETPVVALTANAISGMKDYYYHEGFADYLGKPIEPARLETSILRFVSDMSNASKNDKHTAQAVNDKNVKKELSLAERFPFLDTVMGLSYCMDAEDFYIEMLGEYVDGSKAELLQECLTNNQLQDFRTYIHAVKSMSLNIGAVEVSALAKALEKAAAEENRTFIDENYDFFIKKYTELLDKLKNQM